MKFNLIIILFFLFSCAPHYTKIDSKKPYVSKGFALIYNDKDYENKLVLGKLNNETLQISHKNLKTGSLIKIINLDSKESLVLKNTKKIKYPDFYKVLISKKVAEKLNLNTELPLVEILEIKKNKSFVAEKAKIYNEEKKISSKAPVTSVKIANISKKKVKKQKTKLDKIYIHIGSFYSEETAIFLRDRIVKKLSSIDNKKLKLRKGNNNETDVISGPYNSINLLKNDYIKLINYGFEELDIFIND